MITSLALSVLPVLVFLLALNLLDTYRLLTLRRILMTVLVGCGVALVCYAINYTVFGSTGISANWHERIGAPIIEEILKAAFVVWLIRSHRVGFPVDAAICGFAVGAGFSLVENVDYLHSVASGNLALWAIRGFGTAMMHGGTTAMFAIVSSSLAERAGSPKPTVFVPGLLAAIVVHSLYNQSPLPPVYTAACVLIGIPILLSIIFVHSEHKLRQWVGSKLDKDIDLLTMIATGEFAQSPAGVYLRSLQTSFPAEVLGDMLCYVQMLLELSARAKGDLLRKEMGFPVEVDASLGERFKELAFLERSVGRAGKLALAPLLSFSRQDLWEIHQLNTTAESVHGTSN